MLLVSLNVNSLFANQFLKIFSISFYEGNLLYCDKSAPFVYVCDAFAVGLLYLGIYFFSERREY